MAGAKPLQVFNTRTSSGLFVQRNGPNTVMEFLGECNTLGDAADNKGGVSGQVQNFDGLGGWVGYGHTVSAPDGFEVTVTSRLTQTLHLLERILDNKNQCPVVLYSLKRCNGEADNATNWERAFAYNVQRITSVNDTGLADMEEDKTAGVEFTLAMAPGVARFAKLVVTRQAVTEVNALNSLDANTYNTCPTCEGPTLAGDIMPVATNSAAGPATANVLLTTTGGSPAATAADPFAAAEDIAFVRQFMVGDTRRIVVGRKTTDAGAPAEIAYSDDSGATWNLVNVGSTNGQVFLGHHSIHINNSQNIWVVTDAGYIYKSTDGCVSWTTQDAGATTANDLYAVIFYDDNLGYAVGESNTILRTENGGVTWSTLTGPTAQAGVIARCVACPTRQGIQVGYDDGDLYTSNNGGDTWDSRPHTGSGVGKIYSLSYFSQLHGMMARDTAGGVGSIHETINGGKDWKALPMGGIATNGGLRAVQLIHDHLAWACGLATGGTGTLLKIYAP